MILGYGMCFLIVVIIRRWIVDDGSIFVKGKWNGLRPPLTKMEPPPISQSADDDPTPSGELTTKIFWEVLKHG